MTHPTLAETLEALAAECKARGHAASGLTALDWFRQARELKERSCAARRQGL